MSINIFKMNKEIENGNDYSAKVDVLDEDALVLHKYIQLSAKVKNEKRNYENENTEKNEWRKDKVSEKEESTSIMTRKRNSPEKENSKNNEKVQNRKFDNAKVETAKIENNKKIDDNEKCENGNTKDENGNKKEENEKNETGNEKDENAKTETIFAAENAVVKKVLMVAKELCPSERKPENEISIACKVSCRSKFLNNSLCIEDKIPLEFDGLYPKSYSSDDFPTEQVCAKPKNLKKGSNEEDLEMSSRLPQTTVKNVNKMFFEKKKAWFEKNKIDITSDLSNWKVSALTTSKFGTLNISKEESQNQRPHFSRTDSSSQIVDILNFRQKSTEEESTSITIRRNSPEKKIAKNIVKVENRTFDNTKVETTKIENKKKINDNEKYENGNTKDENGYKKEENENDENEKSETGNKKDENAKIEKFCASENAVVKKVLMNVKELCPSERKPENEISIACKASCRSKFSNNSLCIEDKFPLDFDGLYLKSYSSDDFPTEQVYSKPKVLEKWSNEELKMSSRLPQTTTTFKIVNKTFFEKKKSWLKKNKTEITSDLTIWNDLAPTTSKFGTQNISAEESQNNGLQFLMTDSSNKTVDTLNFRQKNTEQELNDKMRRINFAVTHRSKDYEKGDSTSYKMSPYKDFPFFNQSSHQNIYQSTIEQHNSSLSSCSDSFFENKKVRTRKCLTYEDDDNMINDACSATSNLSEVFESSTTQAAHKIKASTSSCDLIRDAMKNKPETVSVFNEQQRSEIKNFLQDHLRNDHEISVALEESRKGSTKYSTDVRGYAYSLLPFEENVSESILDETIGAKEIPFARAEYDEKEVPVPLEEDNTHATAQDYDFGYESDESILFISDYSSD